MVLPFSFVCLRCVFFRRLALAAAPFALCWINLHPFQRLWIWSISPLSSPVNPDNLKRPFVSWRFYLKSSPSFNFATRSLKGVESQILGELKADNPGAAQQWSVCRDFISSGSGTQSLVSAIMTGSFASFRNRRLLLSR